MSTVVEEERSVEEPIDAAAEGARFVGLNLFAAKQRIVRSGYRLGALTYVESGRPRFSVLKSTLREDRMGRTVVDLVVSSVNPIRFLPSMYQNSQFLRDFLWIFQHIHNECGLTLDNLHSYFTPSDTPEPFLRWLSGWFDITVAHLLPADKLRLLLHHAVSLYRWRGTVVGMQRLMELLTGIKPEILENQLPYDEYTVGRSDTERVLILESRNAYRAYFTVYFPVYRTDLDKGLVAVLMKILDLEKPANTLCLVAFKQRRTKKRSGIQIGETTAITEQVSL